MMTPLVGVARGTMCQALLAPRASLAALRELFDTWGLPWEEAMWVEVSPKRMIWWFPKIRGTFWRSQ